MPLCLGTKFKATLLSLEINLNTPQNVHPMPIPATEKVRQSQVKLSVIKLM
jgi:hypothetical protein